MKIPVLAISLFALLLQGCAPVLVGSAAVGAIAIADDKRTTGTILDDKTMALKISGNIQDDKTIRDHAHINVTSFNGVVLLTGEAANADIKHRAEQHAYNIGNIRQVVNEIWIGPNSPMSSRTNDTWITSKVKSKLFANKDTPANRVKIVTEAQTVYVMGLVTRAEATRIIDVARNTDRVKRVVKLLEYTD